MSNPSILPPYTAWDAPREANVDTTLDEFFSPWPWCPYEKIPHDQHLVSEGNNYCAGVAGTLRAPSKDQIEAARKYWQKLADDAEASLQSAESRLYEAQHTLAALRLLTTNNKLGD